ncbi:MAG: putative porin [Bacteroidales bacterium]|nr:putative porin [Bacteroidaceae bacterium]MDO4201154.1 putative porin [Bacteroidales bacterium]
MNPRHILLFIFFALFVHSSHAQRIISELETNSDMSMDARPDSAETKKKKKIVPNDVRAWTVDEKYGNMSEADVDTLHHMFMNTDLPEGIEGHYNSLGNVGSPRQSRIYMERPITPDFIFVAPFDMFFVDTDNFRFYNTKSPFMNVTYNWNGSKNTGSDHVKVLYTNNAGKKFNFGGIFDYIYGRGYYDTQSTSYMNASAWASYIADKYNFHFYYQHNFMKTAENGGIEDEGYITNPENMARELTSNDIPTVLSQTWNRQEHDVVFFNHHYNIGFYRDEEVDSVTTKEVFVPVSKIFHSVKLQNMMRNHRAYKETENYHSYTYLPGDSTQDYTKYFNMKTLLGVSMCEGFNKWAMFGLNAYVGYEHNRFVLPDSTRYGGLYTNKTGLVDNQSYKEHNILVGGQIIRTQGTTVHYNLDGEFVVAGEDVGQFEVDGHAEVNIPLLGDTAQVALNASIKNIGPSFYFDHYHSKHAWWENEMENEFRQRIEGVIDIPHTHTKITLGVENIKNYCYFQNTGIALPTSDGKSVVSNNVSPMQCSDNIQVVSANLRQNFKLGILHWENDITYQTCSHSDVLPLPVVSLYTNLYLRFKIAKVLKTEFGADMKYFTEYNAPDYSPVIGMFMNQHQQKKEKVGNYPLLSVYANFDLKRTRFYVMYHHFNQSDGRYFWSPNYPMNPASIRFGLSWNFYD